MLLTRNAQLRRLVPIGQAPIDPRRRPERRRFHDNAVQRGNLTPDSDTGPNGPHFVRRVCRPRYPPKTSKPRWALGSIDGTVCVAIGQLVGARSFAPHAPSGFVSLENSSATGQLLSRPSPSARWYRGSRSHPAPSSPPLPRDKLIPQVADAAAVSTSRNVLPRPRCERLRPAPGSCGPPNPDERLR